MSSNPFASRFIRPGAIPFLFLDGDSAAAMIERMRGNRWWGQIIGPHGSGKSTLLATLTPALDAAGRSVILFKIGPGERRLPPIDPSSLLSTTQIVIDGYEQLSWWSKWKIRHMAWRAGAGLLVTTHANAGFATLYQTKPSEAVALAVVKELTAKKGSPVSPEQISAAYHAAGGNLRETLFKLFDAHRQVQSL